MDMSNILAPIRADLAKTERMIAAEMRAGRGYAGSLAAHAAGFRGKRLRPALVFLSARACGGVKPVHHEVAAAIELIHAATLIHDDVLDDALLRRRLATINRKWGNEAAVLLGDFVLARSFMICARIVPEEVRGEIAGAAHLTCLGEIEHTGLRHDLSMTSAAYFRVIERKTAALFAAAGGLGAFCAGGSGRQCHALREFGRKVGTAFQIIDDCLDMVGDERVVGKTLGSDIVKGKITLPVLHVLGQVRGRRRAAIRECLRAGGTESGRRELVKAVIAHGGIGYSRRVAEGIVARAKRGLAAAGGAEGVSSLLQLADFIVQRIH
jgi:octaprenyl-diphosphate synthase